MRDLSARLNLRELHSGPDPFWAGQAYIGLSGPGYSRAPARVRTASQPSPPPVGTRRRTTTQEGGYGLWPMAYGAACCTPRAIPFPREAKSRHSVGVGRRNRITTARRIPCGKLCGAWRGAPNRRRVCRRPTPGAAGTFPAFPRDREPPRPRPPSLRAGPAPC